MSTNHKHDHECTVDWDMAQLCAEVCKIVYSDEDIVHNYLKSNKIAYTDLRFFSYDNAQAYGIDMQDYMIVAFRGTQGAQFKDILADIKAWPSESETQGNVHSGFKTDLDKVYPQIIKWLGKGYNKRIIVTGHSLGAAMATICASRFHAHGADLALYTFGSPRVGNREWAEQFNDIEAYRFVNNNDIVCQVPSALYYTHVGILHYISYDFRILTHLTWFQRFVDKLKGTGKAWSKFQPFDGIYDHFGKQYVKKLKGRK